MPSNEMLESVVSLLEKNLTTQSVIGEAVQVGDITLIPVMDLTFGFGGGGGEGKTNDNMGSGGGAGGAARLAPKAVVVIQGGDVKVMPFARGGTIEKILESVPGLIEKIQTKVEKKGEGKNED